MCKHSIQNSKDLIWLLKNGPMCTTLCDNILNFSNNAVLVARIFEAFESSLYNFSHCVSSTYWQGVLIGRFEIQTGSKVKRTV